MTTYQYEGMDNSGIEVRGFMDAGSTEEAQAKLRGEGLFVTKIGLFAPEVTPEWSAISLTSPSSIPSERLEWDRPGLLQSHQASRVHTRTGAGHPDALLLRLGNCRDWFKVLPDLVMKRPQ